MDSFVGAGCICLSTEDHSFAGSAGRLSSGIVSEHVEAPPSLPCIRSLCPEP